MNLLIDPWIPVRERGGSGPFRLLRLEEVLCGEADWRVSLSRDDLEMACLQMLISLTQVLFIPDSDHQWRTRLKSPLSEGEFAAGIQPYLDWFDLDHPNQPFMQVRGVRAAEVTPIQKLLPGLPEGNNHAFFNRVDEVRHLSPAVAAIALFNQAVNSPSFGGGFKGGLRGGAPLTTLIWGQSLRQLIWRNVITVERVQRRCPAWVPGQADDQPTWVQPIRDGEVIHGASIGLLRGLFWQPAHVELLAAAEAAPCDVLGNEPVPGYVGFNKAKFNYSLSGMWAHPHGVMIGSAKKSEMEWKFMSFTTTAPAWTRLSEIVVPQPGDKDAKEGSVPAAALQQQLELQPKEPLHLLVGGYMANQAAIVERRHELIGLAAGWGDDAKFLTKLIKSGLAAKKALRGKLYLAAQGNKDKGVKGIGTAIHEVGEAQFYALTEGLFHDLLNAPATFAERQAAQQRFIQKLGDVCRVIYQQLTDPYGAKPELIAAIAWGRRALNADLNKLLEETP